MKKAEKTNAEIKRLNVKLIMAARRGDVDAGAEALEGGADNNAKDRRGWPVIVIVARHGYLEFVRLLDKHGANLKLKTDEDHVAKFYAELHGHSGVAAYIKRRLSPLDSPSSVHSASLHT